MSRVRPIGGNRHLLRRKSQKNTTIFNRERRQRRRDILASDGDDGGGKTIAAGPDKNFETHLKGCSPVGFGLRSASHASRET